MSVTMVTVLFSRLVCGLGRGHALLSVRRDITSVFRNFSPASLTRGVCTRNKSVHRESPVNRRNMHKPWLESCAWRWASPGPRYQGATRCLTAARARGASGRPGGARAGCWPVNRRRRSRRARDTRGSAVRGASTRCSRGSGGRTCVGTAAPWRSRPAAPGTPSTPVNPTATTRPSSVQSRRVQY